MAAPAVRPACQEAEWPKNRVAPGHRGPSEASAGAAKRWRGSPRCAGNPAANAGGLVGVLKAAAGGARSSRWASTGEAWSHACRSRGTSSEPLQGSRVAASVSARGPPRTAGPRLRGPAAAAARWRPRARASRHRLSDRSPSAVSRCAGVCRAPAHSSPVSAGSATQPWLARRMPLRTACSSKAQSGGGR